MNRENIPSVKALLQLGYAASELTDEAKLLQSLSVHSYYALIRGLMLIG